MVARVTLWNIVVPSDPDKAIHDDLRELVGFLEKAVNFMAFDVVFDVSPRTAKTTENYGLQGSTAAFSFRRPNDHSHTLGRFQQYFSGSKPNKGIWNSLEIEMVRSLQICSYKESRIQINTEFLPQ